MRCNHGGKEMKSVVYVTCCEWLRCTARFPHRKRNLTCSLENRVHVKAFNFMNTERQHTVFLRTLTKSSRLTLFPTKLFNTATWVKTFRNLQAHYTCTELFRINLIKIVQRVYFTKVTALSSNVSARRINMLRNGIGQYTIVS